MNNSNINITKHSKVDTSNFKANSSESYDIDDMIEKSLGEKCTKLYYNLETCLADNDRDWRKCQNIVKLLKDCKE